LKKEDKISKAVSILKKGGVIIYPTETVYGLGVDIFNEKAVNKLYQLKGRDFNKPLSIFVSSLKMLENYVEEIPPQAKELIQKYWAGPLTLVFKASSKVPKFVLAFQHKFNCLCSIIDTDTRSEKNFIDWTEAQSNRLNFFHKPVPCQNLLGYNLANMVRQIYIPTR